VSDEVPDVFHATLIPMSLSELDDARFIDVNDAFCELFGHPRDELIGRTAFEVGLRDDPDTRAVQIDRLRQHGRILLEMPYTTRDGTGRFLDVGATLVRVGDREAMLVSFHDVTERTQRREELAESEASARKLFADSPVPMWVWDPETLKFLDVNEASERQYGYSREEFLRLTAFDIRPESEHDRLRGVAGAPEELHHFGTWIHRRKDGSQFHADIWSSIVTWHGARARLSLCTDVTDRDQAERDLRDAEERYRRLVEDAPAVVYRWFVRAHPGHYVGEDDAYVSPQIEEMLGFTPEEWMGEGAYWRELIHPQDHEAVTAAAARSKETGEPFEIEYRYFAKDGHVVWVFDRATLLARDEKGRPAVFHGVMLDITARKEAEVALRETRDQYQRVLQNISDLVALIDPDGTVVYASPSHEQVLGRAPAELIGKSMFAFENPADVPASSKAFARALKGERTPRLRFRMMGKDGHLVQLEGTGWQPILDDGGRVIAVMGVSRDVTMRELVEEERRRAEEERRSLLARLVDAGEEERRRIADDVHDGPIQVLTALQLRLEALSPHVADTGASYMNKATEAVRESIRSLRSLMFDLRPRILDREGLVAALRDQARALSEETDISVRIQGVGLQEEPSALMRTVLYRIAQEALTNVRKHAKASQVEIEVETTEEGTRLRVEDDGVGIPVGSRATGGRLGLAAMRDRAELVGGIFRAEPRPGGGTIVEAVVPGGIEDYGVVDPAPRPRSDDGSSPVG
jgi:PAS domain S-box-containing protein